MMFPSNNQACTMATAGMTSFGRKHENAQQNSPLPNYRQYATVICGGLQYLLRPPLPAPSSTYMAHG
jgi:hypothetical protein